MLLEARACGKPNYAAIVLKVGRQTEYSVGWFACRHGKRPQKVNAANA